jgi:hypothetical protein
MAGLIHEYFNAGTNRRLDQLQLPDIVLGYGDGTPEALSAAFARIYSQRPAFIRRRPATSGGKSFLAAGLKRPLAVTIPHFISSATALTSPDPQIPAGLPPLSF